jgi:Uma2 family endonuclease
MSQVKTMQATEQNLNLRLWTVTDYHRMAKAGILEVGERVELLEGKIIRMSAKGTAHTCAVGRIDRILQNALKNRAWVSIQDPVTLNDRSEPEPDISVVKIDPLDYADHHPTPSEVYLITEVADSSFKFDCETKGKAYSQAGISDYWVLDVVKRQLYVFREPTSQGYQNQIVLDADAVISPLEFPDFQIHIQQILPPLVS